MQVIDSKLLDSDGQINDQALITELKNFYSGGKFELIGSALELLKVKSADSARHPTGISSFLYAIEIAYILFKIRADEESVAAGILYELYNFGDVSDEGVAETCNYTVLKILQGTRKMSAIRIYRSDSISLEQIDTFRKMLLTIIEDVRIVLVKIVDKLCTIRHLKSLSHKTQQIIARETLDVYAPLANRLGLGAIKWELEDRAFFFLEPQQYKQIAKSLGATRKQREDFLYRVTEELKTILKKYNLDAGVQGRVKHIYSIYKKLKNKGYKDIDKLFDITAIRVVANNIDECYKVLAEVNDLYSPIPEEFSDYIVSPKSNGYKSIHTVVNAYGQNLEIQIRTHKMHEESELGFAAHWRYKEGVKFDASYEARVAWLRSLLEWEKEINEDISKISKELNRRVYVFTPANELIDLAEGSTVLDFAYSVHTMVGHRTKGAKLNDKIVPLTTKLATGDRVEILTQKEPNPSKDWASENLGYLTSARNRSRVIKWFNEQNKEDNVALGKDRLLKELKGYDLKEINFVEVANKFNMQLADSLFAAIENGSIRIKSIVNYIIDTYSAEEKLIKKQQTKKSPLQNSESMKVLVSGFDGMKYEFAKCCQPMYPDRIEGYMSVSKGVVIHTNKCPNLKHLKEKNQEKFIEVRWE
ncbi:bifunctional (p)ppGpp synthetase/guanosine-3',5'-bis(diphosphate) 3'-pyrophosphohydrolase [Allofrancisella guangzhouensis]|uniref:GTP pyrophosphokinase n=1 Tax=Allofrancisella guangzhouensis TaxID=594679 RepID=A0A0A8EBA6_9GAMM|nr:RelA/SpoT family protein [Allofrancisella guangzhouensis]AJC49446.1 GDP pyrophosphokinase [Allofrancisella guangzhouensis]MBK2026740.1 bifunctional (p)ppGpp synthetase/guanosine-3',5'-bis(diphosphate) 3'-pyrophosphohydrolase [Allofrancisella guangzhouensis]MBK2044245.1 bifunctional (p)ppGpp synthetase/guanosine-3',5'-bis(diphosphate) 3'-pyrophosphohydrolase [Allofrancisella guangzhouensis]MBK2046180.1 bifunctional (p)ppGpp synthetase/guanosine-3',5'-bis(diphosphate) 3'-pyrophosphohydrolase [